MANSTEHVLVTDPELIREAVVLAQLWARAGDAGSSRAENAASARLAHLVADPAGLDLAVAFVDRVARPEDIRVAAAELRALPIAGASAFLTPVDRTLLGLGRLLAPLLPGVVVPAARIRLRQLVGHLVVDAADPGFTRHVARAKAAGYRLNINLLGEAVLGEAEARSRVERTMKLLERSDVDYVSLKVSALVSQISTWDTPGTVDRVLERLRPLYRLALAKGAFVNLDMEEYRDLDLTIEVFTAILSEPEFADLEAGIVLQAYLPDAPNAFERLVHFAMQRRSAGGAGIKVRLVKGANLAMEAVDAELHGWRSAPHPTKAETDATYVRILDRALSPEVVAAVRIGVAGHNLYHLALAHLLATRRGVAHAMEVEMLQGMAPGQARAVKESVGAVLLYTPVVAAADFDVAVSYLVRRLEENAAPQNFLHQSISSDGRLRAEEDFRASVREAATVSTTPRRGEVAPDQVGGTDPYRSAADLDPAVRSTREAVRTALAAPAALSSGSPTLTTPAQIDDVVARARALQPRWAAASGHERAAVLRAVGRRLAVSRLDLLAVMGHEAGKTAGEADPEISEAIDFAHWYASGVREGVGAVGVTLVTPPWNFPVAIAAGGVLAALAAGSAVVMKPSPLAPRCGEAVVNQVRAALADAGFEPDLVQLVQVPENEVGRHLIAHEGIDQVVLTGSLETAELFAGWRANRQAVIPGGPRVFAETSGKNALIVTPSADLDLAVADVVRSAFGHAGQKCSAASLVILVGSVASSRRFHDQLRDAVTSLRVGLPQDLGTGMGPVIEAPSGKLLRALTQLEPGERWSVQPRELPVPWGAEQWAGRLWTPGVRSGVKPGSWFHLTECFGPVLGVMRARTLSEAIAWQNAIPFGLTGGIHSLDRAEVDRWLDQVEVGNAYINRHITGAVVQRQPFGGWKGSVMGPGAKAGGPNYVEQLGLAPAPTEATWRRKAELSDAQIDLSEVGEADDAAAGTLLAGTDEADLVCEENTLRYRVVPELTIRLGAGGSRWDLLRVLNAAAGTLGVDDLSVSVAHQEGAIADYLPWQVESEEAFAQRVANGEVLGRVRWLGGWGEVAPAALWQAALGAGVTVIDAPVSSDNARELRTMLREQAISRTRHRYGHVHE